MKQKVFLLFLLLLQSLCAFADFRSGEAVALDSVTKFMEPAKKMSLDYYDDYGNHIILTVYNDSSHRPMLVVKKNEVKARPRVTTDTILLDSQGRKFREAYQSMLKGELEKYNVRYTENIEKVEEPWKHVFEWCSFPSELICKKPDSYGNWTEARDHNGHVRIKRELSYDLSPDEQLMLNHYSLMGQVPYESPMEKAFVAGLLILLVCVGLSVRMMSSRATSKFRIVLFNITLIVSAVGLYIVWRNVYASYDWMGGLPLAVAYVVFYSICNYRVVMSLEDDRSVSNATISAITLGAGAFLAFLGWVIGSEMWHVWWAALLTTLFFLVVVACKPSRGERCDQCRRMGTVRQVNYIECGTERDVSHNYIGGETVIVRVYNTYCTERECSSCGYRYRTPVRRGEILSEERFNAQTSSSSRAQAEYTAYWHCAHYRDIDEACHYSVTQTTHCRYARSGDCRKCPKYQDVNLRLTNPNAKL